MGTAGTVVLIIVIVVVVLAAAFVWSAYRRRSLRQRFGPEYDAAVDAADNRRAAEGELRQRERRHQELDIQPLSPESQRQYTVKWAAVQEQFVDDPTAAVAAADTLVTALIAERGYPTDGYDQQLADLSVEHAQTLTHYRAAHDISVSSAAGTASTEDLRQALVHYRSLFGDLLGTDVAPAAGVTSTDVTSTDPAPADVTSPDMTSTDVTSANVAPAGDVPVESDVPERSDVAAGDTAAIEADDPAPVRATADAGATSAPVSDVDRTAP